MPEEQRTDPSAVGELMDGWRKLAAWQREGHPGWRRWNTLVDKLNRIAENAITDPARVTALRQVAAEDPDPSVRLYARQWVTPYVPRPDSAVDLARWMNHPLVDIASMDLRPRVALALVPDDGPDDSPDADLTESSLTWLRGTPVAAADLAWPRRADDIALAHLVQAEIGNQPLLRDRYPRFPDAGVLQFFHDLETSGHDLEDGKAGAWQIRLLDEPAATLLRRPDDLGDDAFGERWPAEATPTWTFPSSSDLDIDGAAADRLDIANERVRETLHTGWGISEKRGPIPTYPLILGHGAEPARDIADLLREVRPPRSAEDHHVLLLSVPGEGPFDGWLGDSGNLEFWIRDSDLRRNAVDEAWALLR
ncbi:DUF1963 domain-containing protein [Actinoplanes sp. NPDC051346]|uniref:DUF1963 domain-containing protein n=1 Tax=Actinoplanes sp. NPDC051346 TaxID=3155048 RepID=UPI0034421CBC